jgi:AraC-like DNA-binding protein
MWSAYRAVTLRPQESASARVLSLLDGALEAAPPTLADIARALHTSPRSLQRQLRGEGASLLIAATAAFTYRPGSDGWMRSGCRHGVAVALLSFAGVHIVQAGYTTIDNTAWIVSGLIDMTGPVASGIAIAAVLRPRTV